jgi:hypothetical protein
MRSIRVLAVHDLVDVNPLLDLSNLEGPGFFFPNDQPVLGTSLDENWRGNASRICDQSDSGWREQATKEHRQ